MVNLSITKSDEDGPLKMIEVENDGWYVVGEGWKIVCIDEQDAKETLASLMRGDTE